MREPDERVAAAKLWILSANRSGQLHQPYLAPALYALRTVLSRDVTTSTCDEHWRLYVNPEWLEAVEIPSLAAHLVHAVTHLLHDHAGRARSMGVSSSTSALWTLAADACVAEALTELGAHDHGLAGPEDLGLPARGAAEEHYARLSQLPPPDPDAHDPSTAPEGCGSGGDGLLRFAELGHSDDALSRSQATEIRRRVAIAYTEHVQTHVGGKGIWDRWVEETLDPVIPWASLLRATVRRAAGWASGQGDYTYQRRSRRQGAVQGVVLPGMRRPLPTIAMIVDTSGSIDDGLLAQAMGEVKGALQGVGVADAQLTVISCDAEVQGVSTVRRVEDVHLGGGGGTDMTAGLVEAELCRPRPDVTVVLTDGYTPWPPHRPALPVVIIAVLGRAEHALPPTPAWATRVECVLR